MKKLVSALRLGVLLSLVPASAHAYPDMTPSSRKYADVTAYLDEVATKHPKTVALVDLGKNDTGQSILGLRIGTGPVNHLVVATHHGNEYASTETALGVIDDLVAAPIAGLSVTVIPVLNVSGYDKKVREEKKIDPNRDYPGPCGSEEGPFSLKSTKALADYVDSRNVVASVTLHTFGEYVLLPWGFYTKDKTTNYDTQYEDLGYAAASTSGYQVGNSGALLYPANGCYEDYVMWKHGVWSLLIEMGTTHKPTKAATLLTVAENVPGIRRFLEEAPRERAEKHDFVGKCSPRSKSAPKRLD